MAFPSGATMIGIERLIRRVISGIVILNGLSLVRLHPPVELYRPTTA